MIAFAQKTTALVAHARIDQSKTFQYSCSRSFVELKFRTFLMISVLGGLLSVGSCAIQRYGPDQAIYCDLGRTPEGVDIYCPRPVLNGGWPASFAFDRPGISVEDEIGFPEDDFRLAPFIANLAFYILFLLGLWAMLRRIRRSRR